MIWDPVLLDCAGNPESAVVYRLNEAEIVASGQPPAWREVLQTPETSTLYEPTVPALGNVTLIDIEATDAAGNRSEDCAQD